MSTSVRCTTTPINSNKSFSLRPHPPTAVEVPISLKLLMLARDQLLKESEPLLMAARDVFWLVVVHLVLLGLDQVVLHLVGRAGDALGLLAWGGGFTGSWRLVSGLRRLNSECYGMHEKVKMRGGWSRNKKLLGDTYRCSLERSCRLLGPPSRDQCL